MKANNRKKIIVAIDGHSSCGKSTIAKALARKVNYIYVDTGAMYRAVTLYSLRNRLWKDGKPDETSLAKHLKEINITFRLNEEGLPETYLNGENVEKEIREMEVSSHVSPISTLASVRSFLVEQQQAMGKQGGIVMDGRDIGTTVFPNAELKLFVTARPEIRADRRLKELQGKGNTEITFAEVLKNIEDRDYIDSHREVSPLRRADDALVLDNSDMTREAQNEWVLELFEKARSY